MYISKHKNSTIDTIRTAIDLYDLTIYKYRNTLNKVGPILDQTWYKNGTTIDLNHLRKDRQAGRMELSRQRLNQARRETTKV